jgi:hypothetical protein
MKYLVVLFWTLILGQVVGYIACSLSGGPMQIPLTAGLSLIVGLAVIVIAEIAIPKDEKRPAHK